jgi:predicted AAA+ superfamily ATPase
MIPRQITKNIQSRLGSGKIIILLGARQVGKTTVLEQLFKDKENTVWMNGDEQTVRQFFSDISAARLEILLAGKQFLVIDEAQQIEDIGARLKLLADKVEKIQVIATGSSSFEIASKTSEPLTGRKWEHKLYPLSFGEMVAHHGLLREKDLLPHRLVYGYYPEIVTNPGDEKNILRQLSDSYLYKDILRWEGIQKPDKLIKLLQALALQVGSQVSFNEVGQLVGIDPKTVEKYIMLLEQCFVIFRLGSFSRNLRNELKNSKKVYFYDNGIRNALLANFSDTTVRADTGALWENFLVSERRKKLDYENAWKNTWFWRTKQQQEIDYIEESDGQVAAYEFKWNPAAKARLPRIFLSSYPNATFATIHRANVEAFLLDSPLF